MPPRLATLICTRCVNSGTQLQVSRCIAAGRSYGRSMAEPERAAARPRILIAGGGIAGLEAVLALHELAPDRAHVTVVAPDADRSITMRRPGLMRLQIHRSGEIADEPGLRCPPVMVWQGGEGEILRQGNRELRRHMRLGLAER